MLQVERRRGFTLIELFCVIAVIAVLLALAATVIAQQRERARRDSCMANMKNLALALHNHHDGSKSFPAGAQFAQMQEYAILSLVAETNVPGSASDDETVQAPFSFLVRLIPYLERYRLYISIDLDKPAFDKSNNEPFYQEIPSNYAAATQIVPWFRCPSYTGPVRVDPRVEPSYAAAAKNEPTPMIGNYVALGATTIKRLRSSQLADGVIYPGKKNKFRDIVDGDAATAMLCETKERVYAAWFDGTTAVVVATHPNQTAADGSAVVSLNRGGTGGDAYLQKSSATRGAKFGGTVDWQFGPSSEHPGLVVHAFADAAVSPVSNDIDLDVYQALVTRSGEDLAVGAAFFK